MSRRSSYSTFLLVSYTVILFLALVAPLDFYPRNAVTWLEHADGIRFTSIGIVRSVSSPTRLYTDLTSGEGMTAEVLLSSHFELHPGPARILSYSGGARSRNFSLDRTGMGSSAASYVTDRSRRRSGSRMSRRLQSWAGTTSHRHI